MHTTLVFQAEDKAVACPPLQHLNINVGVYQDDGLAALQHLNINVGLYRDDGLAATNQTPRNADKIKKEICKIFKENGLSITADANKKVVDFLDVTLNLSTGLYQPYQKPNNKINYIHRDSNHPPPHH